MTELLLSNSEYNDWHGLVLFSLMDSNLGVLYHAVTDRQEILTHKFIAAEIWNCKVRGHKKKKNTTKNVRFMPQVNMKSCNLHFSMTCNNIQTYLIGYWGFFFLPVLTAGAFHVIFLKSFLLRQPKCSKPSSKLTLCQSHCSLNKKFGHSVTGKILPIL